MREKFQLFLESNIGRASVGALLIAGCAGVYTNARSVFGSSDAELMTRDRAFICSETMKVFEYRVQIGDTFPVPSPYSDKPTGYQAEACYWTAEGEIKREPTWVLLNSNIGVPGPTFCPDCGRRVTEMNDPPIEGQSPPPLQSELARR